MKQAVQVNVKDMAQITGLACQLAPSSLWGEPLHNSGLFAYLVSSLQEDKVCALLCCYVVYGSADESTSSRSTS